MPEVRPLCSTGITRLHRSYEPLRHRRDRAWPSRVARCGRRRRPRRFPVLHVYSFDACRRSLPRRNRRVRLSHGFLCNAGLPRVSVRSASATSVSRPRRAFICITARIFAGSPSDPFHRRLRRVRCLPRRFDCYWASDPSQAGLAPAEIHTPSRRTDTQLIIDVERWQVAKLSAWHG